MFADCFMHWPNDFSKTHIKIGMWSRVSSTQIITILWYKFKNNQKVERKCFVSFERTSNNNLPLPYNESSHATDDETENVKSVMK